MLCEGAQLPRRSKRAFAAFEPLRLQVTGRNPSLRLRIENITLPILKQPSPRSRDLLRIAAYVYGADTTVRRWSRKDVFADDWTRDIHFVIPVMDHAFWKQQPIIELLADLVGYLTGDRLSFEFVRATAEQGQLFLGLEGAETVTPDSVTLFSGGLDSLTAVVEQLQSQSLRPVLVSSRSTSLLDARQKRLVALLRDRFPHWPLPHVSMWTSRMGSRAVENTQRSRALVFLALGVVVAAELGLPEVRLCDNGIMSINLPRLPQTVGTMATRSTHPLYLRKFEDFASAVYPKAPRIANPFAELARFEVVDRLREAGQADLIQETVSCSRTEGMTNYQPHCGTCTQCIDRRFATVATGLEVHDPVARYERDIFTDPLKEGSQRAYAESFVRAAVTMAPMSPQQFLSSYPELEDCVVASDEPSDVVVNRLIAMHIRHSRSVVEVLQQQLQSHSELIVSGRLSATSLLGIVARAEHTQNPQENYARRLAALLAENLPKAFQGREPSNESEVQAITDAVLGAALESLKREVPLLPFGAVTTKPDFSDLSQRNPLFLELKLVRDRADLRRVTKEITSRIIVYGDQGASVLFPVYDPRRSISDDLEFRRSLERHPQVWVQVIR